MATEMSLEIDHTLLRYLGRGAQEDSSLEKLGNNIWGLPLTEEYIEVASQATNRSEFTNTTSKSTKGAECCAGVKPNECIKIGGGAKASRDSSKMKENGSTAISTKTATIRYTDMHGGGNAQADSIHYAIYEQSLSEDVLKVIGNAQHDKGDFGKLITDLSGENSVDKLQDYIQDLKKWERESSQRIWQMVANTCCSFLVEKKYTSYVHSIELGAVVCVSKQSRKCSTSMACGAQANAGECVDGSCQIRSQRAKQVTLTTIEGRGELNEDESAVKNEEVIKVHTKPVFHLIKQKELKLIMKKVLSCYCKSDEGALLGPFKISSRENLHGNEHEIHWKVSSQEIHGTTTAKDASIFYVKHVDNVFRIIHTCKTDSDDCQETKYFVYPDVHQLLTLEVSIDNPQKISFTLKNNENKSVDIPQTEATWMERSPFFIKRPEISGFKKANRAKKCYLRMTKRDENPIQTHGEESTLKHNEASTPKCTVTSTDKKDVRNRLMLFYFKPATNHELPARVTLPARRIESDCSESMKEVLPRQPEDSTLSVAHHLSPTQRIESDFSQDKDESSSEQEELKAAFFELVGKEYTFPLQVKANGI